MMNDPELIMTLLPALGAGAGIGLVFFTTLWISVRSMARPGALRHLALGALARGALILVTTAWVLSANVALPEILAGLGGFIIVRVGASRLVRPTCTTGHVGDAGTTGSTTNTGMTGN